LIGLIGSTPPRRSCNDLLPPIGGVPGAASAMPSQLVSRAAL
jgi:hypothetical protein